VSTLRSLAFLAYPSHESLSFHVPSLRDFSGLVPLQSAGSPSFGHSLSGSWLIKCSFTSPRCHPSHLPLLRPSQWYHGCPILPPTLHHPPSAKCNGAEHGVSPPASRVLSTHVHTDEPHLLALTGTACIHPADDSMPMHSDCPILTFFFIMHLWYLCRHLRLPMCIGQDSSRRFRRTRVLSRCVFIHL
jgi:hypothetical protein